MIFNNTRRKAFATVGAENSEFATHRSYDALSFSADNNTARDFGNFGSGRQAPPRRSPRKPAKKQSFIGKYIEFEQKDKKLFMIIGAALAALILVIFLVVLIANSIENNIVAENNAYTYFEKDGLYYVAEDGEIVGAGFENKVKIVPARDMSFAYVIEDTPDGKVLYLLEDEEISQLLQTPVAQILALADYVPGVVYKDDVSFRFYSNGNDDRITKDASAANFIIAPDATAVAYTVAVEGKVDESKLCVWENGFSQSYASNMIPVELSKGGKHLYAYGILGGDFVSKSLHAITIEDGAVSKIATGFDTVTAINIEGDELMYSVGTAESGYQTYIYELDENKSHKVGAGICSPLMANATTVQLETFKNSVAENTFFVDGAEAPVSATYYIGSDYASESVAQYNGKLSSDGDIFYYLGAENTLFYVELDSSKKTSERIADDVVAFEITEKNNVYYVDDYDEQTASGYLTFYKFSTNERKRIQPDVTKIAFNKYSNILYFTALDTSNAATDEEDVYYVFQSEEGSGSEGTEFDDTRIMDVPHIINNSQKRTFAYVDNTETGMRDLYYTSNGKTYKLVQSGCNDINSDGFTLG